MIFVLAGNREEAEAWRERAGLPSSHITYLAAKAGRGRMLARHELITVGSFWDRQDVHLFRAVLLPCGIDIDRLPHVGEA